MEEKINPELEAKSVDIAASAMKSAVGMLPTIGPFLSELVGFIIPNQRFDRIVKYSVELEKKLQTIDNSVIKLALQDENFTELMEESIRQAASSVSDERRIYIASLVKNSLTPEEISFIESKRLLKILGEINDIEVIWLRFYLCPLLGGDTEFRKKHENVIKYDRVKISSSQKVIDKEALQKNYQMHLAQLGLLRPKYDSMKFNQSIQLPIMDFANRGLKINSYEITPLGSLLIRQIDLNYDYRTNFPK
jgi:hypothetical protein